MSWIARRIEKMVELDDLSFRLIFDEIGKVFTFYRDGLAAYGVLCGIRRAIGTTKAAYGMVKIHWFAKHRPINVKHFGKWAVITGCSEGIGKAFAQELAHQGLNIMMLNKPVGGELERVAQEIREQFSVEVSTVTVDFSRQKEIYTLIERELTNKEVGILVNNVGVNYSYPMPFLDVSEERLWHLINVNVAAVTLMTSIVLPQMVKRRRGAIINLASGTAARPVPLMAVYSATKSYVDNFSRALQYEYRDKGILVQSLMPHYVATRMTSFSRTLSNPALLIPTATDYVRHALTTLGYSSRTTGYWPHTLLGLFFDMLSDSVWLWLSNRMNHALRRQAQQRPRHRSGGRRSESASSLSSLSDVGERKRSLDGRRASTDDGSPRRKTSVFERPEGLGFDDGRNDVSRSSLDYRSSPDSQMSLGSSPARSPMADVKETE